MKCVVGFDTGLSGALAFSSVSAPDRISVEDMPVAAGAVDAANLAARIRQMAPDLAVVERVNAMPGQGVGSTFKFGASYGAVLGVLAACGVPTQLVTPSVWKRHFKLSADKEQSRALALRLFPACAQHFSRKCDHNRAEAALIARFGAEKFLAPIPALESGPHGQNTKDLKHE